MGKLFLKELHLHLMNALGFEFLILNVFEDGYNYPCDCSYFFGCYCDCDFDYNYEQSAPLSNRLLQFQDFVQLTVETGINLLKILRLSLSGSTFEYVQNCKTYDDAIAKQNEVYVKLKNVIFARYELISRKQPDGESLE
ncbi:hypothetical protein T07_5829 [Trichinella nelsoni]|uniref:Uncharacterized protein n=1 Tax=Trichinella nelsoni TaxID=6336 RepID=A0A0V0REG8_9BILA|nr:hypothetical protein T07_5829 [Trichinella nelsoni]